MRKLTVGGEEISVHNELVAHMADRMHRFGRQQRENYIAKAQRRLEKGPRHRSDVATVIAAGK